MGEEPKKLTLAQFLARLPDRANVHTFRNPSGFFVGADWDRDELVAHATRNQDGLEFAGPIASAVRHGLVIRDERGALFVEEA